MMNKLFLLPLILLAGCMGPVAEPQYQVDQCIRAELFKACLANAPEGPTYIHNSNDWEEVISACDSAAYRQSLRKIANNSVKKECQ